MAGGLSNARKTMLKHLLASLLLLKCNAEPDVMCDWKNDPNANLKWIPPPDSKGDLMVESCQTKLNCKQTAFLVAESFLGGKELSFSYLINGDHRNFLQLETDSSDYRVLWKASGDWYNPQTDWNWQSVMVPSDINKLFFSGYVVSSSAQIRLKGIGIAKVSPRCENFQKNTTMESLQPPTTSRVTTSTKAWSSTSSVIENESDDNLDEEEEETLEIQKIQVVPELVSGFTKEIVPVLCNEV